MIKTYENNGITVELTKNNLKIRTKDFEVNFKFKPSIYLDELTCTYYRSEYGRPYNRGYINDFFVGDEWIRRGCLQIVQKHYFPQVVSEGLQLICEEAMAV